MVGGLPAARVRSPTAQLADRRLRQLRGATHRRLRLSGAGALRAASRPAALLARGDIITANLYPGVFYVTTLLMKLRRLLA